MSDDVKVKCKEYEITLTNKTSGREATVKLSANLNRWVVSAEGYSGYF